MKTIRRRHGPTPPASLEHARHLRQAQTDAERRLWAALRDRRIGGAKFRRQYAVGSFVADFCCFERRLIVELDGGQHASREAEDRKRTEFLSARGFRVLRFWDNDVLKNTEGVLERILEALQRGAKPPSP